MYYPESIITQTDFEKKLRRMRCVVSKGKAAEIELQNLLLERKITNVKASYSVDKLGDFLSHNRRERESAEKFRSQQQPRQPRPQTARSNTSTNVSGRRVGSLPTIKADRPRPQSASMYKSSSISISSSNKDFSELFASTLEWPRPRTLPRAASHPPPSSSAPVTDGFISASVLQEVMAGGDTWRLATTPDKRRSLTRMGSLLKTPSKMGIGPKIASARGANGMVVPEERLKFLLHLPNDTYVEARRMFLGGIQGGGKTLEIEEDEDRSILQKASSKSGEQDYEEDVIEEEEDEGSLSDPTCTYECESFFTLTLWRVARNKGSHEAGHVYLSVCVARDHDATLVLAATDCTPPYSTLGVRKLSLDDAWRLVETSSTLPPYASSSFELNSAKERLMCLCEAADLDHSGSVTRENMELLLSDLEMGLSREQAVAIATEAAADNGVAIHYIDLAPRIIEMTQAYGALTNVHLQRERSGATSASAHLAVCDSTYSRVCRTVLDLCEASDPRCHGAIPLMIFKSRLQRAKALGLTSQEAELLTIAIPRDNKGRCLYKFFRDVYYDVRFNRMKSSVIESVGGSDLLRFVVDLFKREDARYAQEVGKQPDGQVPLVSLISRLLSCSRLSLSRAQVVILCSEATTSNGLVSVYEFAPVLAGMLEIMLSSQEEKVKADLLSYLKMDTSSLSEENALTELHAKLKTLFELTDEDSSGELDKKEFEACLLDLDVGLKVPEIRVLFAVADTDMSGSVSLEEFKSFCCNVLVGLLREKVKLRSLHQHHIKKASVELERAYSMARFEANLNDYKDLLRRVYTSAEKGYRTGKAHGELCYEEYRHALETLHIDLSELLRDIMLSEIDCGDGVYTHMDTVIDVHAGLMLACKAIVSTGGEFNAIPVLAEAKGYADVLCGDMAVGAAHIIMDQIRLLDKDALRWKELGGLRSFHTNLQKQLRSPACAWSRSTANFLAAKLQSIMRGKVPTKAVIDELCVTAVRVSVFRSLVLRPSPTSVHQEVLSACEGEARRVHGDLYTDEDMCTVSLHACVRILHGLHLVSLQQSDIIGILVHCEALALNHTHIRYLQFARAVSERYAEMSSSSDHYRLHAEFNAECCIDDDTLLGGLSKHHLMDYLRMSLSHTDDFVPERVLIDALLACPLVHLKLYEANLVTALCDRDERGHVCWKDFLHDAYSLVYCVCRQKYEYCRLPLFRLQRQLRRAVETPAREPLLESLAERLLNLVRLVPGGMGISIELPTVLPATEDRRSRKMKLRTPSLPVGLDRCHRMERSILVEGNGVTYAIETVLLVRLRQENWGERLLCGVEVEGGELDGLGRVAALPLKLPSLAGVDEDRAWQLALDVAADLHIICTPQGPRLATR